MNKYIKQNQSRDNLNKKQKQFFKNHLTDNKDYLVDLSDNLFVPFHSRKDEDYLSFKKGKGKELEEKLRAQHSSAALCVNFFKYWKEKDPIGFYKILWETMRSKKLEQNENLSQVEYEFEAEHLFGTNNINLHTFRHTYAHNMLNKGVPKEVLQTLLGHRSIKTTEIYANWVRKEELERWI